MFRIAGMLCDKWQETVQASCPENSWGESDGGGRTCATAQTTKSERNTLVTDDLWAAVSTEGRERKEVSEEEDFSVSL